ncbi:hypothetical protein ANSO36C_55660 [Nostoc cf. commune SO-36]|uniref:Nif11 domain-containing protein n=1 Tax=Nostoc cf. commune SO-36 TaxID=449208 RepID=A0ABM7Z962_NOSCO|nr:Nif11-like leader peptide family natural product precursor [Nostoc commune]BDI19764.1 hypothetical protein ANSO36C_55660 [Nostoc cf. commune SO-36]
MSIQNAKAFFNAVLTNDNFRSQLQSPKTNEERAVAIRAAGYDFTPEESQQLLNQIIQAAAISNSLSEAELEAVSGGLLGAVTGPGALLVGSATGIGGAVGGAVTAVLSGTDPVPAAVGGAVGGFVGGAQGPA